MRHFNIFAYYINIGVNKTLDAVQCIIANAIYLMFYKLSIRNII